MAMKKELLAPAGDIEAGYAALYYGADAVYLGLKQFSARATANNFDAQELNEFVGYTHSLGKKVFVTINTVLQETELDDLLKNLDVCRTAKADAVIVQDLGVARVVKHYYPELKLHASTQMAIHNKEGAMALQKLGFERVVLARELTLSEIKKSAEIKGLELECFVHGALCYSYSGICQFSSITEGRSANRGKCLYPCRAEFVKDGKVSHCFSMKDLALEEDILKLPVYSLKIEGRKKTALYVAAVVDYYRHILDGEKKSVQRADNIKQIFARPWCKFHFNGKDKTVTDREYVGHRGLAIGRIENIDGRKIFMTPNHKIARYDGVQIDVKGEEKPFGFALQQLRVKGKNVFAAEAGEKCEIILPKENSALEKGMPIYLASSSEVKGAYGYKKPKPKEFWQKAKVDVNIKITQNEIVAEAGSKKSVCAGDFAEAQDKNKMEMTVQKAFAKTGDMNFDLGQLTVDNADGRFVPVSLLNELRRNLYEQIELTAETTVIDKPKARIKPKELKRIIEVDDIVKCQKIDMRQVDEVIYLISEKSKSEDITRLPKEKVRIALPVICRDVNKLKPLINLLSDEGYKKWEISNYWGLEVLPKHGIDISFDSMLYMLNTQAIAMAKDMGASRVTLSAEDTLQNMQALAQLSSLPLVFTVYQNIPLFTSAVCVRDNDCKSCDKKLKWSELQKGEQKYLLKSENCQTEVYLKQPFAAAEVLSQLPVEYSKADFCHIDYSADEVADIWKKLLQGEKLAGVQSANLYHKVF